VLDLDGTAIGWAWLAPRVNFVTKETYGDLRSFYIAEPYRGGSSALRLMRACLDLAREHGLARLVGRTNAHNENMQALYRLFEFEPKHITFELFLDKAQRK
jgi:GNAT superfamily N-acetyltransferase